MKSFLLEPFCHGFMQRALIAVVLAGVGCASIGVYVVLRRLSFLGGALTHSVLPGIVWAHFQKISIFWGALLASFVTATTVNWISSHRHVKPDTAIGIILSASFALGILMISLSGSFRNFEGLLLGNLLGVSQQDLKVIAKVSFLIVGGLVLFYKELKLSSFDPDYADFIGVRPKRLQYLLLLLVALSVVAAIRVMGVLLATTFLITPAATACLLAERLVPIFLLSVGIAIVSGLIGLYCSFYLNISAGAAIALVCSGLFLCVWESKQNESIEGFSIQQTP